MTDEAIELRPEEYYTVPCPYIVHDKGCQLPTPQSGPVCCDGSLRRCRELSNEAHFGGRPSLMPVRGVFVR